MIYWEQLKRRKYSDNSSFDERPLFLFGAQPALTRVNKQIRAESLPIYYAANRFRAHIFLNNSIPHSYPYVMRYQDFCRAAAAFTTTRKRGRDTPGHLCHMPDLEVEIEIPIKRRGISSGLRMFLDARICSVIFSKSKRPHERDAYGSRLNGEYIGGEDTDWADREVVDALVKQWVGSRPCPSPYPKITPERLVRVLWLLGVNLGPGKWASVGFSY